MIDTIRENSRLLRRERMYAISFDPAPTTLEESDRIVRKQLETFGRVAKAVGLISK